MWHRLFIHGNEDDGGEFQYTIESIDVNGDGIPDGDLISQCAREGRRDARAKVGRKFVPIDDIKKLVDNAVAASPIVLIGLDVYIVGCRCRECARVCGGHNAGFGLHGSRCWFECQCDWRKSPHDHNHGIVRVV